MQSKNIEKKVNYVKLENNRRPILNSNKIR